MTAIQLLPLIAYAGCAATIVSICLGIRIPLRLRWLLPLGLGFVFIAFSAATIAQEGLMQFWANHTSNLAGNQVWFDLILAVTLTFVLIAPRARAVGMSLWPWGIAVISTACIALLPMFARLIWLEQRSTRVGSRGTDRGF